MEKKTIVDLLQRTFNRDIINTKTLFKIIYLDQSIYLRSERKKR